jgi:hypothetical protein
MEKLIINARLALEQIVLRLRTVSELGDVVSTLGPAVGVLRSVRAGLVSVFPEAETELGEIGNMLSGIMMEAGTGSGMTLNFDNVNEDAGKILTEAATVAEQRVKEKFPDLPPGINGNFVNIGDEKDVTKPQPFSFCRKTDQRRIRTCDRQDSLFCSDPEWKIRQCLYRAGRWKISEAMCG